MTLVDTNVVIDLTSKPTEWFDWSVERLTDARIRGDVFINDIVFAKLASRYVDETQLEKTSSSFVLQSDVSRAELYFARGRPLPNTGKQAENGPMCSAISSSARTRRK